jgi:hypothetical protein
VNDELTTTDNHTLVMFDWPKCEPPFFIRADGKEYQIILKDDLDRIERRVQQLEQSIREMPALYRSHGLPGCGPTD